ncbi:MAG TPA: NADPH-dependent F420 reductase [Magnetospirillaceae bacterium]|nr:NADPH-dependent F420 reductase [Magnetospirillaceae bacterium]
MSIGIIGAGALGSSVARALAKAGVSAVISNSRGPASLAGLVEELGPTIKAVTTTEAAKADIVFISVRWVDLKKVLGALPAWNNRIVVDTTNAVEFIDPNSPEAKDPSNPLGVYGIKPVDLGDSYSSKFVRDLVPGARVVKAFNHLPSALLTDPSVPSGQRVLFYSGDDADAKAKVRALIEKTGFFPADLGSLEVGGRLAAPPFGVLGGANFVKV